MIAVQSWGPHEKYLREHREYWAKRSKIIIFGDLPSFAEKWPNISKNSKFQKMCYLFFIPEERAVTF